MFQKIVIANRGEIAVRVIRACREMGIKTVALYSEADRKALHAQLADESVCIGPASAGESYLNMERVISATIAAKADAIHPGFGFLSENAKFVEMCEKCNITFIGPSSAMINRMGNKSEARKTMEEAGVPIIPGTKEPVYDAAEAKKLADEMGYPIMVKASSGGGGKGMRIVETSKDFIKSFQTAQQESIKGFGDNTMYMERYVRNPRHVEVQILADKFGNTVYLGERDCSVQKNHQKLIEEAPCMALSDTIRKEMGEAAVRAARAVSYENAGTIEFLYDKSGNYYFMEMNTRIQVEHPITEMVTGLDLIKEQIRIASGEPLAVTQEEVTLKGHSIECRINAQTPGTITNLHLPGGNGIRVDTAIYTGYTVPPFYDSMIAKIIVHDADRTGAIKKMLSALGELVIEGIKTNVDSQFEILRREDFLEGNIDTGFLLRGQS